MKKNMGILDRTLRTVLAITLILLFYFKVIVGPWAIAGIILSVIFLGTSAIGTCPLYLPFGLSTKKANGAEGST